MIIEIIVIILSFLITGYGIYRYGGNEVAERQNVVQGDEDDNNDDSDDLDIDNEPRNDNDRNNGIINNNEKNEEKKESENNDNEKKGEEKENNRRINFAENFIRNFVLKNESFVNLFEWGDIKKTAENLINRFPHINSSTNENIIEILERIKKEEGENAFRQWLQQKYQGSIKSQEDKEKIITLFKRDKAATIYKNTTEEIRGFLNKIKEEEETDKKLLKGNRRNKKELNSSIISIDNSENIININNEKMSFKEQVNEQIETNKNNIDWGNLTDTARKIYNCLNKDAQLELNALKKIEYILKEKKSNGEEEAAKNWLDKNKKNINIETITTFVSSDENIYQNTSEEIIDILLNKCNQNLSDGQSNQLKEIKITLLEKKEEEKEQKEKELKEKIKNYDNEVKNVKQILGKEPDDNNPDVCFIKFRVPDGEKILERKFLKTDKISILYDYVKSKGREIFMEPDATDFDILSTSGFPPKNLEPFKNSTLEQEGFFPNVVLQIKEK